MVAPLRGEVARGEVSGRAPPDVASFWRTMRWYHYVSYFFGGAFLANAVPHFVNGVSGRPFQSPFASPPGEGLSSSTVNAPWGSFNLPIGYVLVCRVASFELRQPTPVSPFPFRISPLPLHS